MAFGSHLCPHIYDVWTYFGFLDRQQYSWTQHLSGGSTITLVKRVSEVAFLTGQPLGYYGSWSLFSLSHHYLVWLAADKAAVAHPFREYALLGDDIVISNPKVAEQYQNYLNKLGVSISIHKSIISRNGCLEFAKRFWAKNLTKDLSPISLKAILNSVTLIGLVQLIGKYQCYLAFQLLSTYSIRLLYKIQKT